MQGFRTIPGFVRALVALFVLAQFAGVVSSPLATAHATVGATVAHASHQHADSHHAAGRDHRCAHPGAGRCDHVDYCCALHAFFAGILPPATAIDNAAIAAEKLHPAVTDAAPGLPPGRLDRPPRPRS